MSSHHLINTNSPWMPVTEFSLRQDEENAHVEPGLCTACGAETISVIGCPDGAEVCPSCFDAGAH